MIDVNTGKRIELYFGRNLFAKSTAGPMLERHRLYWQLDRTRTTGERDRADDPANFELRKGGERIEAVRNDAGGVIGHRIVETMRVRPQQSEPSAPAWGDIDLSATIGRTLDAIRMARGGRARYLTLQTYYGTEGARFLRSGQPQLYSLLHLTQPGLRFLRGVEVLLANEQQAAALRNPIIAAKVKAGRITVAQLRAVPGLDGPTYQRMLDAVMVRRRAKYAELAPAFSAAEQLAHGLLMAAAEAWAQAEAEVAARRWKAARD